MYNTEKSHFSIFDVKLHNLSEHNFLMLSDLSSTFCFLKKIADISRFQQFQKLHSFYTACAITVIYQESKKKDHCLKECCMKIRSLISKTGIVFN